MFSRIFLILLSFLTMHVYGAEPVVKLEYADGHVGYKKGEAWDMSSYYIIASQSPAGKYTANTHDGLLFNSKKITEDIARDIYNQLKAEHEGVDPQLRITQAIHNVPDKPLVDEPLVDVDTKAPILLFAGLVGIPFIMVYIMKYFGLICCTQGRGY